MNRLGLLVLFVIIGCSKPKEYTFLVGTYTDDGTQGINVVTINENNELSVEKVISGVENPSFVIANKTRDIVVCVEETASEKGGKVTSFAYNSDTGTFKKINSQFTLGDHPCSLTFSPDEKYVLVGNYSGGNLTVFPIDAKGTLSENSQVIAYKGKSVNTERQEKPHVHCVVFHPKENKLFVADLGRDVIETIPFNAQLNPVLQSEKTITTQVSPGSGPRHLLFNSAGTRLYATFELTNEVAIFDYKDNKLQLVKTIPLTKNPTKSGSAAELRLSKDEQFLYASVRGSDNQLSMIPVKDIENAQTVQTVATGISPRNFIITKDQQRILVGNQSGNTIMVFDRDYETGLLRSTTSELILNKPVYFFPF